MKNADATTRALRFLAPAAVAVLSLGELFDHLRVERR